MQTREPVVLQVLPRLETGGVEQGAVEIAEAVQRAGGRAIIASEGGRLVARLTQAGALHVTLPLASKNPWRIWRNAEELAALGSAQRVQLIHARSRAPAWSARAAARRLGVPFVTTYHGAYTEGLPGKRRYNAVMASGDRVIAISRFIARLLVERHNTDPGRVRVIPRGVDPDRFDPDAVPPGRVAALRASWEVPDGVPIVLLPGRLTRWKGQAVLLHALPRLARTDAIAVLAGSDQGRAGYRAELERAAPPGRVRFAGEVRDMPAAMLAASVVVSASTDPEAFGRVVVEGQAMGRPVVATAHGGAMETIEPGVTGSLVPPGDAGALARALDDLLAAEPDTLRTMGEHARARVLRDYTTAAMQRSTLAVYGGLLQR